MAAETRERIIAGAYRTLSRNGYEHTSIKDIAREAGVAPGLIHYYFDTKEDLLVATVRHVCEQMQPSLDDEQILEPHKVIEIAKTSLTEDRPYYQLLARTIGVALHNPRIAEPVRELIREQRADVERIVHDVIVERGGDATAVSATAAALWGGLMGIVLQDLLEDEFDAEEAIDALAWLTLRRPIPETEE